MVEAIHKEVSDGGRKVTATPEEKEKVRALFSTQWTDKLQGMARKQVNLKVNGGELRLALRWQGDDAELFRAAHQALLALEAMAR
jgi:hypothetical protein